MRLIALLTMALLAGCAGTPKPGSVFSDGPGLPRLVVVPAGAFDMGADKSESGRPEGPVRHVTIKRAFALAELPVTNAEFGAFVAATGYVPGTDCRALDPKDMSVAPRKGVDWRNANARPAAPDEPVVCVSWRDAKAYVAWLTAKSGKPYRLPSEAEYEYVARAGSTTDYPWGSDPDQACRYANIFDASAASVRPKTPPAKCDDGHPGIAPVGSYPANAFGLKDMLGNAWQWLEDCYEGPYPPTPVDGSAREVQGACQYRAIRGGSWYSLIAHQRVTFRGRDPEDQVSWIFGFRVARDLP